MNHLKYFIIVILASIQPVVAQIDFNANTVSNVYNGSFLYGSNMGWRGEGWQDEDIADILTGNERLHIAGIGVNSLRPALYEYFVEEWGYDIRVSAFRHYAQNGASDNTVFIGYPSDKHKENKRYCTEASSEVFANLYEPIWDGGANGTPVNEQNYYASYVYQVVKRYGGQVKFWEVWNEPDYTWTGHGDADPGEAGNWWDNDPDPCDLAALRAPIQSYVRMLRITYEVVKSLDPDAFVCLGGIGYASFMDAVLRNTDNPDRGKVTAQYPEKGGAWFDCVSYHIYPMYYLRRWSNEIGWFEYFRNSDAAVQTVTDRKDYFQEILARYGYGTAYPGKEYIITETNIPRKSFDDLIGSDAAQRNYLVKSIVAGQRVGIRALYVFGAYEGAPEASITDAYEAMGLYKYLPDKAHQQVTLTESAIAWRTAYQWIGERTYDATQSQTLNLPAEAGGGAFYSAAGDDYVYVLWAKTTGDHEQKTYDYRFPSSWNLNEIKCCRWDGTPMYELENAMKTGNTVRLTESPIFIRISGSAGMEVVQQTGRLFEVSPTLSSGQFGVKFELAGPETAELNLYTLTGSLARILLPRQVFPGGLSEFAFDVKLPPGVYILTLTKPSGAVSRKIVVK